MIKKSLLLLALLCGSAAAGAPSTVSKTSVDDFAKIARKAEQVKNYSMGDDASLELMEEEIVFKKHDSIRISYQGIESNAFRIVKNGCEINLDINKEDKVLTANVDFINDEGNFQIKTDEDESITIHFVKDGDKYVISTVSLDQAKYNVESVSEVTAVEDFTKVERADTLEIKKELEEREVVRATGDVVVKGAIAQFQYADDYEVIHNIRGVKCEVHAVLQNGNDIIVKEGYTDNDGKFSFLYETLDGAANEYPTLYFVIKSQGTAINVVDENNELYRWQSSPVTTAFSVVNLNQLFTMESAKGRGFSVSQAAIMASNFAKFINNGEDITTATVHYPEGTAGCWYSNNNHLYITGKTLTDAEKQYRPSPYQCFDVIGHEYGHHVQKVFNITANPGGTHYSRHNAQDDFHDEKNADGTRKYTDAQARDRGIKLAYAEGWATAYSLLAQAHFADLYDDVRFACDDSYTSYNGVNVDYGAYQVCLGEGAEESVTSFIWNIFDDEASEEDPWDTVSYPDDLLMSMSHDSKTFSQFMSVFEEGDPDREWYGQLCSKLKMAPAGISAEGTLYTNVAPTFTWDCAGGSKYYTNNEFIFLVWAEGAVTNADYYTRVTVEGTPATASHTIPLNEWTNIVNSGATELHIHISAYCNRNGIQTGGYETKDFIFPVPTTAKPVPTGITMTPADWGFEQKYDNTVRTKGYVVNGVDIATERLRTGRIESNQIVLSAKKKNCGKAYFRITADQALDSVTFDVSLWGSSEGINKNNSTIIVETMNAVGDWTQDMDLWNDVTLPTDRNNMITLTTHNTSAIYGIKFIVTAPATGSNNNGRLALRNISFNF